MDKPYAVSNNYFFTMRFHTMMKIEKKLNYQWVVVVVVLMVAALATTAQAVVINSFVNADFDSGIVTTGNGAFAGFDAPAAPEIIGWSNYGTVNDAGVEAAGAWWLAGYTNLNAAFVNSGGGASNMSSYVIQAGDAFDVSFSADYWDWGGSGQFTVSLFYNDPANVIGSFTAAPGSWNYITLTNPTPIVATAPSVGGTLGITFLNTGTAVSTWDEVVVNVVPEPATLVMLTLAGAFGLFYVRLRKR
jgi:hypothetical protein